MKYTLKGYGLNTIIAKSLAITERDMVLFQYDKDIMLSI